VKLGFDVGVGNEKRVDSRYGHTIKFTPHPIPNCEVKLDGPVQYWGGGPPGKFVVLYLLYFFACIFLLASSLNAESLEKTILTANGPDFTHAGSFLDAFFGQVGFLLFKRNWMVLRLTKRGGAEEARWAHNPKVIGSKPILATAHSFAAPPTLLPNLYPLVKCEMWSSQSTPAATAVKWGDACMMFIANKAVALFVGALFLEQNRTTASRLVLRDPAENM
jgi:hypothetical protein